MIVDKHRNNNEINQKNKKRSIFSELIEKNKSGNIVIKSLKNDKEISKLTKSLKQIEDLIEQNEQEKSKLILLRDEHNNNVQTMYRQSNDAKSQRDEFNKEVSELKNKRNSLLKMKNDLLEKKKILGDKILDIEDKKLKRQTYLDLQNTKTQINQVFEELKEITDKFKILVKKGQSEHQNMLAYRKMAEQAKKCADEFHQKVKEKNNEIRDLRKERWKIRSKIRGIEPEF